jgi:hypothetical protein
MKSSIQILEPELLKRSSTHTALMSSPEMVWTWLSVPQGKDQMNAILDSVVGRDACPKRPSFHNQRDAWRLAVTDAASISIC